MNYAAIKPFDVANGPGVRVSLFVSGCPHRCPGCFNSEAWDFDFGKPFEKNDEDRILSMVSLPEISGITVLGGEPLAPQNQPGVFSLLSRIRSECPEKSIWCFTGYVYETEIRDGFFKTGTLTKELLSLVDVLVDGRFEADKRDLTLKFRGSSNQRLLDIKKTMESGDIVWAKA